MAIAYRRRPTTGQGFSLTPLIDLVFLLIIFFLTASDIAREQRSAVTELPVSETAHKPLPVNPRVTVTVLPDGSYQMSGRHSSFDDIVAAIRAQLASGQMPEVAIRAHRDTPFAPLGHFLEACQRAGITQIYYTTHRLN